MVEKVASREMMEELRPVVVGQSEWLCRDQWYQSAWQRIETGPFV